jgi:hypothetical protein
VYKANSWNSWEGLPDFMKLMKKVDRLTRDSDLLHCPAAKYLTVVIALEQAVLQGRISGRTKISDFMRDFDCYNKAVSAICYYESGNRQSVLTLDHSWDLTATAQSWPNRMIDQSEITTFENKTPVSKSNATRNAAKEKKQPVLIKIESSPEHETESATEHQPIQQAGINATTQPGPALPGSISSYNVRQMDPGHLHQVAPGVMHQIETHAMLQAGQPAMNQLTTSFENQCAPVFAHQGVESRERRREEPMPASMPAQEQSTPKMTYTQVTRADVMEYLQPLLSRLKYEYWTGSVQDDLIGMLTEQNVKVITAEAKGMLGLWAGRVNNGTVLSWLQKAQEDLNVFRWTENSETSPSTMWYTDHVHTKRHRCNDWGSFRASPAGPASSSSIRAERRHLCPEIAGED